MLLYYSCGLQSFAIGCLFVHFKVSLLLFVTKHWHVGLLRRECGVYHMSENKMIKIIQNWMKVLFEYYKTTSGDIVMTIRMNTVKGRPPKRKHILRDIKRNCFFYLRVYYFACRSVNFALIPVAVVSERILTQCSSRIVIQRS